MAFAVISLVTEDADRAGFLHKRGEFVEFFPGLRLLQVRGIDPVQGVEFAAARSLAAFLRRAEPAQMQVGNAPLVKPGGKLVLREAGASGSGDGADVDP